MIPSLRAGAILAGFLGLTLPLMPVQAVLVRLGSPRARVWARRLPWWYHRQVCRLIGVRLTVEGRLAEDTPTLIVANHVSWLDIPVLSAVAPVSFVAKSEVDTWPFVKRLARLQRTVLVDRKRRLTVGTTASEIEARLGEGDHIVLFAEGTSSDGNRVLPFRSALLAAAGLRETAGEETPRGACVQTLAIAYTGRHGTPMSRFERPLVAWYGDMELAGHLWEHLKDGPVDVHVRIGPPLPLDSFPDRKALARHAEQEVRAHVARLLRRAAAADTSAPPKAVPPAPSQPPPSNH